jgi:methyl-accepting chemotaxis protein
MKLSTKILLGFGILILLVWVIGLFSITSFSSSSSLFNRMDTETVPNMTAIGEMRQKVAEAHVEFMEFLLSGKINSRDNVSGIIGSLTSLAQDEQKRETALAAENRHLEFQKIADELVQKISFLASSLIEVMDMKTRGSSDEDLLDAEQKTIRPTYDSIMKLLAKQDESYKAEFSVMRTEVRDSQSRGQLIIVLIAAIAMIAGISLAILFRRNIIRPITNLTQVAENISKGEISTPVEKVSNDEIGDLAEAFERMRVSLKVMIEDE